jgi:hypothetical protein
VSKYIHYNYTCLYSVSKLKILVLSYAFHVSDLSYSKRVGVGEEGVGGAGE